MKAHPFLVWGAIAALLTAALGYGLYRYTALGLLGLYLVAINAITFVLYKYDKLASTRTSAARIPNLMLAALAGCGGSVGALLGIYAGKQGHKTSSRYRLLRAFVWLSLLAHIVLLCIYYFLPVG